MRSDFGAKKKKRKRRMGRGGNRPFALAREREGKKRTGVQERREKKRGKRGQA